MNFKKSKNEVISDAYQEAMIEVSDQFCYLKNNIGHMSPTEQANRIEAAICLGIKVAIASLVENTYTDEEFEKDLQLRS